MAYIRTIEVRSPTRIRVFWEGSSGLPNLASEYQVVSLDDRGTSPPVVAVVLITSDATQREIVLGVRLVGGARYRLDSSASTRIFMAPEARPSVSLSRGSNAWDREFYQVDLDLDDDLHEDPSGDLATIAGRPNVDRAVIRQCLWDGLPWDQTWGAQLSEFIDGPTPILVNVTAAITRQLGRDDRIMSSTVAPDTSQASSGVVTLNVSPVYGTGERSSVEVPFAE